MSKKLCSALALTLLSVPFLSAQSSDKAELYSQEGQKALMSGDFPTAEQAYEKLNQLEPRVAEIHANLGLIYFQEHKFAQSAAAWQQALKLKPGLPKADTFLAMSLAELGRYKEALPGLERGFRPSNDGATRRMCGLQLMRAYTSQQQDSKAVAVALEMNQLYPNDPEVLYHTGRIYGNLAFVNMQKLARVAPDSIWRHQAEAEAYESQGSNDAAISEYRQVLSLDPHRPGIHYRIGRTLLARAQQNGSTDDTAQALKEFSEELQIDPSNSSAAYEIGEIHRNAGDLADAQKFFALALQHHPDFEEAQLGLAAVLTSLRKPQEALPHLQKAVELRPDDEVSWYRLAQVEGMLGNSAEQRKAFAKFQQLHNRQQEKNQAEKQLSPDEVTPQKLDANSN